jgi:ribosomal protein L40E
MAEPITVIFIFAAVVAVSAVVFGIWLVVTILKVLLRGVAALFGGGSRAARRFHAPTYLCNRSSCQAINPTSARFCRRCGTELLRGPGGNPSRYVA